MTVIKSGDLVVLKSGGPTMTVDAVNTSIFDDNKFTGVVCVWFLGEKLQRVRFDYHAVEPVRLAETSAKESGAASGEAAGEYKIVLDDMVTAMNTPADAACDAPKAVVKRPRTPRATKHHVANGIGAIS